ncbi:sodium/glutamate symporter [Marinitenerispora sediminis]|uniref:Sodium:glutamate symporter n=1 Tax=Marinitenerispora sediminis TaxID=1931232 RepID=A0A368T4B0_9ACTN|nr:sodium/glutamate symporter [Marinitenerispora sediminis]RCV48433.1 sodium:glutamate symporter [Marinitenerispora sediminis]RCV50143.1 sodium:glutamate symporter [Marinitenerispora sediminis]RCV53049.1 sodium:glutamate symporter [Marinitenerispora sediminis]
MDYTPWALLSDAGLIAALLVVGTVVRAHVPIVQRLMLPASVIAGFLGLLLGPNALGVLPFSEQLGTYSSVLIVVVFACLALTDNMGFRGVGRQTGAFSLYSIAMYALQVGLGMAFALLLLGPVWGTPDGFGILLVGGWAGGFGSAAALGAAFGDSWPEAASLGFASATVGMLVGIIGGIAANNWGVRRGHTARQGRVADLPEELRTGLVRDPERRPSLGTATSSAASIEPLALQLCVVGAVSAAAYGIQVWFGGIFPQFTLPVFALAFVVGLVLRLAVRRTRAWGYLDPTTLRGVSGTATDVLIVCGIASIVPSFVRDFWLPLTLLFVVGLVLCVLLFRVVAPAMFGTNWFEKAVFTWGWSTGAVATSIALLRMVDPDLRTRTLEEFGIAYLPLAPLETATIAFAPAIIMAGAGWALGGGWTALGLVALALPWVLGWTARSRGRGAEEDRVPAA